MVHYNDMTEAERIEYLNKHLLGSRATATQLDDNFIRLCTDALSPEDQKVFVKYMDMEVAAVTYPRDCSDEEAAQPHYSQKFFFTYATAPVDVVARILWHVAARYEL